MINGRKNVTIHKQFMGNLKAAIEESKAARLLWRPWIFPALQAIPASLVGTTAPSESSSSCKTSFWNTRLPWKLCTCCGLFIYGLTNGLMQSAVHKMGSLSLHSGPVSFNYKCSLCSRNIFHCLLFIRSEFPTGRKDEIPAFGRGKYFVLLFN